MSCKEAIDLLKTIEFKDEELNTALQMAITALQIQDGNLYVRDVPGSLSIGFVQGTVYMDGYPTESQKGKMFIR